MKVHLRTHTVENPFNCECKTGFAQISHFKYLIGKQVFVKAYACFECDARLSQSRYFKYNMGTHSLDKPYTCHKCEAEFSQSSNLKYHRFIHTGENPLLCGILVALSSKFCKPLKLDLPSLFDVLSKANLIIYQAREYSLFPTVFLTAKFLLKPLFMKPLL